MRLERVVKRKGPALLAIHYTYVDERGTEQYAVRELVPHAAAQGGLDQIGTPITVKFVFGEPLLQGAPNVFFGVPIGMAIVFAFLGLLFFIIDRQEGAKIDRVLNGQVVPGVIDSIGVLTVRGVSSWRVRYRYETQGQSFTGSILLPASQLEGPFVALGIRRMPEQGDYLLVAHDVEKPSRSTPYALEPEQTQPHKHLPIRVQPVPPELSTSTPRALTTGAPSLATEVPMGLTILAAALLVLFGGMALVAPLISKSAHEGNEGVFLGTMMFCIFGALFLPLYLDIVRRPRRILQTGVPMAAAIEDVHETAKLYWFTFRTEEGGTGRLSLRKTRLSSMDVGPKAGDTVFVVSDAKEPWDKVIWGFAVA